MLKSLIFLLLMPAVSQAQVPTTNQPLTFYQSCFGGVDNYHDSARIDNCDFQDARNVLTYKGYLEKRPGSIRVSTNGLPMGGAITFQNEFINASNVDLLVVQVSSEIFSSDFKTNFVRIATVNVNGVTSSISAFDKHFFVNGYDTPWYTTGTDQTVVPEIPGGCRYLTFANERVWCANAAGYESSLYASAFGDYTNWTIPVELTADAPMSWTMDAQDGKALTCVYSSPYGVLAWKRSKMFIVKGVDNDDFYKFRLSENIGCVDNRSIQLVNGKVTWLGEDGVYQWAGGNETPELISREIDSTIKDVKQTTALATKVSINSQSEFGGGRSTTNNTFATWSSSITPGSLVPSTWGAHNFSNAQWITGTSVDIDTGTVTDTLILKTTTTRNNAFLPTWTYTPDGDNYTATGTTLAWAVSGEVTPTEVAYATHVYFSKASTISVTSSMYAACQWSALAAVQVVQRISFFADSSNANPTNGYVLENVLRCFNTAVYTITHGTQYVTSCSVHNSTLKKYLRGTVSTLVSQDVTHTVDATLYYAQSIGRINFGTINFYISDSGAINITGGAGLSLQYTDLAQLTRSSFTVISNQASVPVAPGFEAGTTIGAMRRTSTGYVSSGTWTSPIYDTKMQPSIGGTHSFVDTITTESTVTYSIRQSTANDGGGFDAWVLVSTQTTGQFKIPFTKQYWQEQVTLSTTYGLETPIVYETEMDAVSSGTWVSAVVNAGTALTSWGQFNSVGSFTTSNASYRIRTSPTAFLRDDVLPAWSTQVNGGTINGGTDRYIQVEVTSDISYSTVAPRINVITFNWFEGETQSVASVYFDKNYFLSINISTTSSAANNLTAVLQRSGKWTLFDGLSYGTLGLYNTFPYAGSGFTESKLWRIMYEGAYYDDNTSTITAYAITKDFQFEGQNNNKIFRQFYLESSPSVAGTLSMAYSVDKSTTYYTSTQSILANAMFNDEIKGMFPGFAKGRYLKLKFSNAEVNKYFKLDAYTIFGEYEKLYRR